MVVIMPVVMRMSMVMMIMGVMVVVVLVIIVIVVMFLPVLMILLMVMVVLMQMPVFMVVVMMVMMLMPVLMPVLVRVLVCLRVGGDVQTRFLCASDCHGHMRPRDPALHGRFRRHLHPREAERVEPLNKGFRIRVEFEKCRGQHVPRRAHVAFQIDRFHFAASMWLIMLAR